METTVSFFRDGVRLATVYMSFVPRLYEYVTLDGETYGVTNVEWVVNSPQSSALKQVVIELYAGRVGK